MLQRSRSLSVALLVAAASWGCGGSSDPGEEGPPARPGEVPPDERPSEPGTDVSLAEPDEVAGERQRLLAEIDDLAGIDGAGLQARYAPSFSTGPAYDPLTAAGFDLIQSSPLGLDADETAALGERGFVISERKNAPTFVSAYQQIYMDDLPVYVSADSILHAVHKSYDDILKAVERASLIPALETMLDEMRSELASGRASFAGAEAEADVDVYLAVALSLLRGDRVDPVAGGSSGDIRKLYEAADAASGWVGMEIFGVPRDFDFSQFTPRGHYTDGPDLEAYFKAMMWLGRIDFRLVETQSDHSQVFHRRQFDAAIALREVMNDRAKTAHATIDETVGAFVGEPDNMTVGEMDALFTDLGAADAAGTKAVDDATIAQAILDGGYGTQRISSHIMINGLGEGTMPLSSTFMLLGQRYVIDSHVFSNVVYDRIPSRMMPDPLDVAFAALGNGQATTLLGSELDKAGYAPALGAMRLLADAHPADYWDANLYNLWLASLRTLSPSEDVADPAAVGLPSVAGTEAWGRRLLGTQLASWAELRHDTILYVKQSYTTGVACEFPDAYVDPYPAFYERIAALADRGRAVAATLPAQVAGAVGPYFGNLYDVAVRLQDMAERQRTGAEYTQEQLDFINRAVTIELGCGSAVANGWYAELFYDREGAAEYDPTIADVHTQPTDEAGNPVGKVLHVGTGAPRLLVATIDTCNGPRAYAGVVSSYFERITENFERLQDEPWAEELLGATPEDPPWLAPIIVR